MGESITVTGMILKATPIGEYDKRVVLLTREKGRISAFARGARRMQSPLLAGTAPFSYGQFTIYEGRNSYTVETVQIQNYFLEMSSDYNAYCYGCYFLEFAEYCTRENVDESNMILLLYQSLRALLKPSLPNTLIRRIFELKAFAVNGEYPDVFSCTFCGKKEDLTGYHIFRRAAVCKTCMEKEEGSIHLTTSTLYTMQYVISSGIDKLYSFVVKEEVQREFERVMNDYLSQMMDKKMKSLDFLENTY